jgi:hypothetical protein
MGGGLMQLVAYGAQDIYLTGNPQITFFKVVYRRHTNFAMESIEQTFNGTVGLGNRVTSTISRNGDLVTNMYLESNATPEAATHVNTGISLIKNVECEIGGQKIDKMSGRYIAAYGDLTQPNPTGTAAGGAVGGTLYQKTVGAGDSVVTTAELYYTSLPFWFCRNPGLALPLIALQYHEVKVNLDIGAVEGAASWENSAIATLNSMKLYVDYIYLDTDERRRFAQVSHEYLIEQVQEQSSAVTGSNAAAAVSNTVDLNFNHPVKELIWVMTGLAVDETSTLASWTAGSSVETNDMISINTSSFQLKLNGHDRFSERFGSYFCRKQILDHHTGFGGVGTAATDLACVDGLFVYSFALKPEEHQPSGTCNFSRIDNAQLIAKIRGKNGTAYTLYVYAVNYNVLRIMSGMGGLAYSN